MNELKSKIWVEALLRRAHSVFAAAYVIRRGDEDAGAVLVKVADMSGKADLYVPSRNAAGDRIWIVHFDEHKTEAEVDAYCNRRCENDPDLWVVEIEDPKRRHFLTELVEER